MSDLISRSELKNAILEHRDDYVEDNFFWTKLFDLIDNVPTIEYPFYQEAYQTGYEEGKKEENERLSLLYSDMANEIARLKSMTGER